MDRCQDRVLRPRFTARNLFRSTFFLGVNCEIVWGVVEVELAGVKAQLELILSQLTNCVQ